MYADKLRSAKNIDDVVTVSTNYIGEEVIHEKTKKKFKEMARGKALLMIGENKYIADVIVGTDYENQSVLYDLTWITPTDFELKEEASAKSRSQKGLVLGSKDASANNLTQKSEKSIYPNKKK